MTIYVDAPNNSGYSCSVIGGFGLNISVSLGRCQNSSSRVIITEYTGLRVRLLGYDDFYNFFQQHSESWEVAAMDYAMRQMVAGNTFVQDGMNHHPITVFGFLTMLADERFKYGHKSGQDDLKEQFRSLFDL